MEQTIQKMEGVDTQANKHTKEKTDKWVKGLFHGRLSNPQENNPTTATHWILKSDERTQIYLLVFTKL